MNNRMCQLRNVRIAFNSWFNQSIYLSFDTQNVRLKNNCTQTFCLNGNVTNEAFIQWINNAIYVYISLSMLSPAMHASKYHTFEYVNRFLTKPFEFGIIEWFWFWSIGSIVFNAIFACKTVNLLLNFSFECQELFLVWQVTYMLGENWYRKKQNSYESHEKNVLLLFGSMKNSICSFNASIYAFLKSVCFVSEMILISKRNSNLCIQIYLMV